CAKRQHHPNPQEPPIVIPTLASLRGGRKGRDSAVGAGRFARMAHRRPFVSDSDGPQSAGFDHSSSPGRRYGAQLALRAREIYSLSLIVRGLGAADNRELPAWQALSGLEHVLHAGSRSGAGDTPGSAGFYGVASRDSPEV